MTLAQMRAELEQQALDYLQKAWATTDERMRDALTAKAEQSAKFCKALDPYIKPESKA